MDIAAMMVMLESTPNYERLIEYKRGGRFIAEIGYICKIIFFGNCLESHNK